MPPVGTGARASGWVEIKRGVNAGESVVVDGNFLIDAESNLRAGAQSLGHAVEAVVLLDLVGLHVERWRVIQGR